LVVLISDEQTKENDEGVGYCFLSGLQNFDIGGNRFINKSIYGKTANPKSRQGRNVGRKYSVSDTESRQG
jgi:hypothetical protein